MKTGAKATFVRCWRVVGAISVLLALVSGCELLRPAASSSPPDFYALDNGLKTPLTPARESPAGAPTLAVSMPRAAPGFDSRRIIYVRHAHELEYFAHSEWIDTPARMLSTLLVSSLESQGAFRAVVSSPSSASGDLRLDSEILQLQHEFTQVPSRVRFTLRADIVEDSSRRVIASRDFESIITAESESPYGGVIAANQSVRNVLEKLSAFCAEASTNWRVAKNKTPRANRTSSE
jgi:cholesterol transport system auxiliary component